MSIFDKLKSTAQQAVSTAAQSIGSKRETFTFTSLPESLAEMQALPEASLDRFRDGKTYLPFTYFAGSTPDNNYTPAQPYTIIVESNHVSGEEQGYMKLFIPCGGADDPRPIKMRQRGSDGKWFLWEQYLLTGVRTPKAADPWA